MLRRSGGSEVPGAEMTWPSIVIVPLVGSSRPAIMRSVVVLPQPDGPSSETNSPEASARLTSSTATTPPKRQPTRASASLLTRSSAAA